MQNLLQKKLKLTYSENVFDIVWFGSSIFLDSEAKDLDIAVIFNKILLKDQLKEAQEIKQQIQKEVDLPVHVSSFDLYSFFDKGNFSKEGVLFYGKSLVSKDFFAKKFGFFPRVIIKYSLEKLEKKDKVRFNYLLSGRGGNYGLLRKYGGRIISPGVVEVLPEYEKIFFNAMGEISKDLKVEKVFRTRD
jgi:hypothetical protein